MPKLVKNMWTNSRGERKLNCYSVTIPKEIVSKTNINEDDELRIDAKENKIVIEKR